MNSHGSANLQVEPASRHELALRSLPEAHREKLPRLFLPQLATAVSKAPEDKSWLHELKFDGYRILCRIAKGKPQLLSRRGNDWTANFPTVARAMHKLALRDTIVDGEVVVLNDDGTSDFQALQNLLKHGRDDDVVYFIFDLPFFAGYNLTRVPLVDRKQLLADLLKSQPPDGVLRYSDHITGRGSSVLQQACRQGLEGIVSKRSDSHYQQRRSYDWVKTKCLQRQEFVIGGWTEPSGSRQGFGALLLGHYDADRLVYCGRVGTGFNSQSLRDIKRALQRLAAHKSPFANPPTGADTRGVHWVEPRLVAEVRFSNWMSDGILRQPSFQGLREDKPAGQVVREQPRTPPKGRTRRRVQPRKG